MIQKPYRKNPSQDGFFENVDAIRNSSIIVQVPETSTNCKIGAIAYVIDNLTQDPYAIPLKK
jgi:hypothetical protein